MLITLMLSGNNPDHWRGTNDLRYVNKARIRRCLQPAGWAWPFALVHAHGQCQRNKYRRSDDCALKFAAIFQALPKFDQKGNAPKNKNDQDRIWSQKLKPP